MVIIICIKSSYKMIYGFAYLFMVLAITAGWIFLAVIPKPEFIQKPLNKLIDIIRPFLSPNREEDNELNL